MYNGIERIRRWFRWGCLKRNLKEICKFAKLEEEINEIYLKKNHSICNDDGYNGNGSDGRYDDATQRNGHGCNRNCNEICYGKRKGLLC